MNCRSWTKWAVWRPVPDDDGAGGQTVTLVQVGTVRGDVRPLTGRERFELQGNATEAQRAGAEHTHRGWFRARADVQRNDELRRGDERLTVTTVMGTFPEGPGARLSVLARSTETDT